MLYSSRAIRKCIKHVFSIQVKSKSKNTQHKANVGYRISRVKHLLLVDRILEKEEKISYFKFLKTIDSKILITTPLLLVYVSIQKSLNKFVVSLSRFLSQLWPFCLQSGSVHYPVCYHNLVSLCRIGTVRVIYKLIDRCIHHITKFPSSHYVVIDSILAPVASNHTSTKIYILVANNAIYMYVGKWCYRIFEIGVQFQL